MPNNTTIKVKVKNKLVSRVIIFMVLILLTAAFTYPTYYFTVSQLEFIKKSSTAEGKVVSLAQSKDSDGSTTYFPVVEYVGRQGEIKTFNSLLSSNRPIHKAGEMVEILVPDDGGVPQINSFWDLWFGSIAAGFFALITWFILIFSSYATIRNWRMKKLLLKEGMIIQAKVLSVDESTYSKSTTLTWLIRAQWLNPQNNKVYTFISEDFDFNPKDYIGETIEVNILAKDPRIYEMNISGLPSSAN